MSAMFWDFIFLFNNCAHRVVVSFGTVEPFGTLVGSLTVCGRLNKLIQFDNFWHFLERKVNVEVS